MKDLHRQIKSVFEDAREKVDDQLSEQVNHGDLSVDFVRRTVSDELDNLVRDKNNDST